MALDECGGTYKKVSESTEFGNHSHHERDEEVKEPVFTMMVAQMMDMEYAHIAGYDGQMIYHVEDGVCFYFKRTSGLAAENQGKRKRTRAKKLKKWFDQLKSTKQAICANPWKLMCMLKYEPRRWRLKSGEREDSKLNYGPWDFPFKSVASKKQQGMFTGFKLYPPLGFQPLDIHLPHLWKYGNNKSECFYGRCENEEIPILSHCSPGGMTTHEIMYYKEFYTRQPSHFTHEVTEMDQTCYGETIEHVYTIKNKEAIQDAEQWFCNNHVHPAAWRKVLEKFPKLKLCLAHFGGDLWKEHGAEHDWMKEMISLLTEKDETGAYCFPNLYTDVACWDIGNHKIQNAFREVLRKVPELKNRLLFGSDWHMILIVSPFDDYKEYCKKWKRYLDEIDETLWVRMSLVNPFEFYGFNDEVKLRNINEGLAFEKADVKKRNENFEKVLKIQSEVENLKKALEKWDQIR